MQSGEDLFRRHLPASRTRVVIIFLRPPQRHIGRLEPIVAALLRTRDEGHGMSRGITRRPPLDIRRGVFGIDAQILAVVDLRIGRIGHVVVARPDERIFAPPLVIDTVRSQNILFGCARNDACT